MAQNEDNIFQADQCDAFDSDVDEAPTVQTMFMENLLSPDLIYDQVGPSYDSDILSKVQDHDDYIDNVAEYHELHEMQNDVQPNYVVDSDAEYESNSNFISYEQYAKENKELPNVFLRMSIEKWLMHHLTAKLARYKEQVE
nr:hypothetical protein [Tanacetum cinerariifolium]